MALARNEDIFFKLGWHVLKNRTFEEGANSFTERNISEDSFFRKSTFKSLPKEYVGIEALRERLSRLLFNHVKQELPKLRQDLDTALSESESQLEVMGRRRATPADCKDYLMSVSLEYYEICKSAVDGHYQGGYFTRNPDQLFSIKSPASIRRLRAVIQKMNTNFSDTIRTTGHKYHLDRSATPMPQVADDTFPRATKKGLPTDLSKPQALRWAKEALARTRGRELPGNYNPLVIGELFWEQSSKWRFLAIDHIDIVASTCSQFLEGLLREKCPKDVQSRLWSSQIQDTLKKRKDTSLRELDRIWEDLQSCPINYNHYYTDTVKEQQRERSKEHLAKAIKAATTHAHLPACQSNHTSTNVNVDHAVQEYSRSTDPDMDNVSCEEALDCLFAIYKVSRGTHLVFAQAYDYAGPTKDIRCKCSHSSCRASHLSWP